MKHIRQILDNYQDSVLLLSKTPYNGKYSYASHVYLSDDEEIVAIGPTPKMAIKSLNSECKEWLRDQ